jgi:hypothetical protein
VDRSRLGALASRFIERESLEKEVVLPGLRDLGMSPIEAIYVTSKVLNLSLPEAKTALYESASWRDQHEGWQDVHSSLGDRPV